MSHVPKYPIVLRYDDQTCHSYRDTTAGKRHIRENRGSRPTQKLYLQSKHVRLALAAGHAEQAAIRVSR